MILGFADFSYLPVAKIWYNQLTSLGYKNHFIVALDPAAYQNLTESDNFHRTLGSTEFAFSHNRRFSGIQGKGGFDKIMGFRQQFLKSLVDLGYNVLATDVDTIWMKYVDVEQQLTGKMGEKIGKIGKIGKTKNTEKPAESFITDIYNAKSGTNWPKTVFDRFGFTVSGFFLAYRSTENTKQFLKKMLERCENKKCDDQAEINNVYFDMGMEFENGEDFDPKNPANRITGHALKTTPRSHVLEELNVVVLGDEMVTRNGAMNSLDRNFCGEDRDGKNWIISPSRNSGNFIESHHVDAKMEVFREYLECFEEEVRSEVEAY